MAASPLPPPSNNHRALGSSWQARALLPCCPWPASEPCPSFLLCHPRRVSLLCYRGSPPPCIWKQNPYSMSPYILKVFREKLDWGDHTVWMSFVISGYVLFPEVYTNGSDFPPWLCHIPIPPLGPPWDSPSSFGVLLGLCIERVMDTKTTDNALMRPEFCALI